VHNAATTQFDAEGLPIGVVSRLFSFDVNSPTAVCGDCSLVLVTEFNAVPEPSTVMLLLAGVIPFWRVIVVVFDGRELRPYPDAQAAIAAIAKAKGPCSAVDLSAIRMAPAE
jgi:hypothetical protein